MLCLDLQRESVRCRLAAGLSRSGRCFGNADKSCQASLAAVLGRPGASCHKAIQGGAVRPGHIFKASRRADGSVEEGRSLPTGLHSTGFVTLHAIQTIQAAAPRNLLVAMKHGDIEWLEICSPRGRLARGLAGWQCDFMDGRL